MRSIIPKASLVYSFDRVYEPSTSQATFFSATTLPLVDKLLQGENGLLFAYGVTNSGKSYTISGGNTEQAGDRGLLPRAVDVVFNSIKGAESEMHVSRLWTGVKDMANAQLRCHGLADVEIVDDDLPLTSAKDSKLGAPSTEETVKVDKNFSYAVFVSYAEVYNDKVSDHRRARRVGTDAADLRSLGERLATINFVSRHCFAASRLIYVPSYFQHEPRCDRKWRKRSNQAESFAAQARPRWQREVHRGLERDPGADSRSELRSQNRLSRYRKLCRSSVRVKARDKCLERWQTENRREVTVSSQSKLCGSIMAPRKIRNLFKCRGWQSSTWLDLNATRTRRLLERG